MKSNFANDESKQNDRQEVGMSLPKAMYMLMILLIMIVVSIGYIYSNRGNQMQVVGYSILLAFFSLCALVIVYKLIISDPEILINEAGVYCKMGLIKWEEIDHFQMTSTIKIGSFIVVYLHDPAKFIKKAGLFARQGMRLNWATFGSPVLIMDSLLDVNLRELCEKLNDELSKRGG